MTINKKYLDKLKQLPLEVQNKVADEIDLYISKKIDDEVKKQKNKQRIIANDLKKEHTLATDILTPEQIEKLPSWVKENLEGSYIIGKSKQVIQIPDGRKYHLKNKLNHLSGAEWTFFINSIINTRYSTKGVEGYAHHIRKIHPSPKPPQLMRSIIEFFTKEDELVLDYFAGVGGTLLGASLSNRGALGIDLEEKYIDTYKQASEYLGLSVQPTVIGDATKLLRDQDLIYRYTNDRKFSLILIDPPYGDMLSRKRTGETAKKGITDATPFTDMVEDLGNMSYKVFIENLKDTINNATQYLKDDGHLVVFIKDIQPDKDNLNLLHADLISEINSLQDIRYLGTKIWADHSVNLYPYGYPYSYVPNLIHQYILTFKYKR